MIWLRAKFTRWDRTPWARTNALKACKILVRHYRDEVWFAGVRVEEINVHCWHVSVGVRAGHHHEYNDISKRLPWLVGPVPVTMHTAWGG